MTSDNTIEGDLAVTIIYNVETFRSEPAARSPNAPLELISSPVEEGSLCYGPVKMVRSSNRVVNIRRIAVTTSSKTVYSMQSLRGLMIYQPRA